MEHVYLDYNATTPVCREVGEAMMPYLRGRFGNPSSAHFAGVKERAAVDNARRQVAAALHCQAEEIFFTGGGTESVNWAIKGIAEGRSGGHIITSSIEHVVVTECLAWLEKRGFQVTKLPVDETGIVRLEDVSAALRDDTFLITIMHANNETGSIQPIAEIAEIVRAYTAAGPRQKIYVHSDCSQSVGKLKLDLSTTDLDLATVAAHKLYAPPGVGALFVRKGITKENLKTFMHGAGHESGRRAGTENIMHLVGLGLACEIAANGLEENTKHMTKMRDLLHELLLKQWPDLKLNGHPTHRLPNTLNVSIPNVRAVDLVAKLAQTVAFSAGSACHSGEARVSHVLSAMGIERELALSACRFSVGRDTTEDQVRWGGEKIIEAATELRK